MTDKVVLYYTNDTSYTLRNVILVDESFDTVMVTSIKRRKISNVVSENSTVTVSIGKSDLLGYSMVDGNRITNVKLSDRFSTLVVTR